MSEDVPLGPLSRASAVGVLLRVARRRIATGRLAGAAELLRQAIEIEPNGMAARITLGDCLIDRRRFSEARRVLETGYLLGRHLGDRFASAACLNRVIALCCRRGSTAEARQLLQQVIRAELDTRGALSTATLVNLSRAMRGTWSMQRRWRLLRGAMRIAKGAERAEILQATGRLFVEGSDLDSALRAFDEARRVAERMRATPGRRAAVVSDQGLALVKAGRYAVAVGMLREAAQRHEQIGNHHWAAKLARLSRRAWRAQQRLDEIAKRN
ncbi:MAG: tetratricopeptide repeat protein [Planctomycetaceae bacterium]|nr:tetratricopeptide repeat protein [Planctomycetaceae bacterium]